MTYANDRQGYSVQCIDVPGGWIYHGGPLSHPVLGSANPLFVCWLGDTCSATVGEPLAAGESVSVNLQGRNMQQQPPTAFSAGATITVRW